MYLLAILSKFYVIENHTRDSLKMSLCPIERYSFTAKCKFIMGKILENMTVKNTEQIYLI